MHMGAFLKPVRSMSPGQCRAARGLLDWTQCQLAAEAGVSRSTVRDFESCRHGLQKASESQIVGAFEKAGVRFIAAGRAGPGVRLERDVFARSQQAGPPKR